MRTIFRSIIVFMLSVLARSVLRKQKPRVIVVAGSVGKTTTKDAIFHILQGRGGVRKSQKSFNGDIGVPLTILGQDNAWGSPLKWLLVLWRGFLVANKEHGYPKTLVLEVGSDHPGDITRLSAWLSPDVVVLTNLPEIPVHVENFTSPDQLRAEDSAILSSLKPGGAFIGWSDDVRVHELLVKKRDEGVRTIGYGLGTHAEVRGMFPKIRYATSDGVVAPTGMELSVMDGESTRTINLRGVVGAQSCIALLGAVAVGVVEDMTLSAITEEAMTFASPPGRMRLIGGKRGSTLIDDCYNSSPIALAKALETLKHVEGKRKIAVLGDMLELGTYSADAHLHAGKEAGTFCDELVTVGVRARLFAEGAQHAGLPNERMHIFLNAEEAGTFLLGHLREGDIVLFKGSQGSGKNTIRLERAIKMLMEHPDEAQKVLVRQEPEWLKR